MANADSLCRSVAQRIHCNALYLRLESNGSKLDSKLSEFGNFKNLPHRVFLHKVGVAKYAKSKVARLLSVCGSSRLLLPLHWIDHSQKRGTAHKNSVYPSNESHVAENHAEAGPCQGAEEHLFIMSTPRRGVVPESILPTCAATV